MVPKGSRCPLLSLAHKWAAVGWPPVRSLLQAGLAGKGLALGQQEPVAPLVQAQVLVLVLLQDLRSAALVKLSSGGSSNSGWLYG